MEIQLDCVICVLRQALRASRKVTDDIEIQEKVLRCAMEELLEMNWKTTPFYMSYRIHKIVSELTGVDDPYREVKRRSNDQVLKLYPKFKELVEISRDPLKTAVKLAIAGNIIDFAAVEKPEVEETVETVLKKKFAINDYPYLKNKVLTARQLLFFADNAGEIVFDKLLLETMIKIREKPFEKITFVVKREPIINDATVEDATYVKITSLPNVDIKTISYKGRNLEADNPNLKKWFLAHDLILLKGQSNYENFDKYDNVFFMLIVKCPVVARDLKVNIGDIVLKYNRPKSPFTRFIR
ncbi:MAG: hypothetical protein DRJ38_06375 [Thermoprotei archaeon]|nr:MAG: hypothetical protein DRJ38_06375 [Thermoprotei archaeon]